MNIFVYPSLFYEFGNAGNLALFYAIRAAKAPQNSPRSIASNLLGCFADFLAAIQIGSAACRTLFTLQNLLEYFKLGFDRFPSLVQHSTMKPKAPLPLSRQIASDLKIWMLSVLSAIAVFGVSIFIQWLIYDDWLHDKGPLRVVGSLLAGALTFAVALRWQLAIRWRKVEILHRFESIKWMTDRIRNSLQAIECVTYAADPGATESVRNAVDVIEGVLHEVLAESHPQPNAALVKGQNERTRIEVSR